MAKAAGVSAATVSRALSNHPSIPEETCKRIQEIAKKMGYQKSPLISILTTQLRQKKILSQRVALGYVTSLKHSRLEEVNATYLDFYLGAKARAEEYGYVLDILWSHEENMTGARFTRILSSRGIKGLIFAPRQRALSHLTIDWKRFASATIGHHFPQPRIHLSGCWHYALIDKALRMLRKYHYQRVGYCIGAESDEYAMQSFSSRFLSFQQRLPARQRVPLLEKGAGDLAADRAAFEAWYFKWKPEVILCVGPVVMQWLKRVGISVPGEVAVVDLCVPDDSGEVAGMWEMPKVIGATAVDLVVEQLNHNTLGIPKHPKSVLFEGRWVDGKTLPVRKESTRATNA